MNAPLTPERLAQMAEFGFCRGDSQDLLESHRELVAALRGEIGFHSQISTSCQYPHVDPCMCDKHRRERSVAALLNAGVKL